MFKITLARIIKSGWKSFIRNSLLSMAAILVMTVTLFVVINLVFFNYSTKVVMNDLKDKVDVSVYFNSDTPEDQILRIQRSLKLLDDVKSVEYVSQGEALTKFKDKHKDNSTLLRSLDELEANPLQPSLNVKTYSASQYEAIVNFLEGGTFKSAVNKINYQQNKDLIARFSNITKSIERGAWAVTAVLALLAILVTFNTIRLAIYNWRNEIGVMKLVGASNWYVRGPFLVEGVLYGVSAALISILVVFPLVYFLSPKLAVFMPGVNLWGFLGANLLSILGLQFFIGIALGVLSSIVAIRRYLEV